MDDEKYKALRKQAIGQLAQARANTRQIRVCVEDFLRQGYGMGFSAPELTDFFCVDTPNIVEDAGLGEREADDVVELFDEIHRSVRLQLGLR